jgi:hypothetical protein
LREYMAHTAPCTLHTTLHTHHWRRQRRRRRGHVVHTERRIEALQQGRERDAVRGSVHTLTHPRTQRHHRHKARTCVLHRPLIAMQLSRLLPQSRPQHEHLGGGRCAM